MHCLIAMPGDQSKNKAKTKYIMIPRAKIEKYREIISHRIKFKYIMVWKAKQRATRLVRRIPKSMTNCILFFCMDLWSWRDFQIFKMSENKWTVSTFHGLFYCYQSGLQRISVVFSYWVIGEFSIGTLFNENGNKEPWSQ